ncbi:hypothetical protein GDO78_015258 [Eleutherodactylus coqui]|uniref:Uncharacterized protein n=1 Tax=Eleutherodactylus coqui TaxID=57060 RepID=A0A8J6B5W7_ELECQ|nr:hypothetical protein GDO78_015258 [Eleutherodactylus coqui]
MIPFKCRSSFLCASSVHLGQSSCVQYPCVSTALKNLTATLDEAKAWHQCDGSMIKWLIRQGWISKWQCAIRTHHLWAYSCKFK